MLLRIQKGTATLENNVSSIPQMVKHRITIWPSDSIPRYTTRRNENTHPYKNLYKNVYNSAIHNYQEVETTQVYLNLWTDKINVVYPYSGILFIHKKEWSADLYYNIDEPQKFMFKWKAVTKKNDLLYDFTYMKCAEEANL